MHKPNLFTLSYAMHSQSNWLEHNMCLHNHVKMFEKVDCLLSTFSQSLSRSLSFTTCVHFAIVCVGRIFWRPSLSNPNRFRSLFMKMTIKTEIESIFGQEKISIPIQSMSYSLSNHLLFVRHVLCCVDQEKEIFYNKNLR